MLPQKEPYITRNEPYVTLRREPLSRLCGAQLDRNHSHFILASNVDKSAPQQLAQLRSNFEACVGQNQEWPAVQDAIHTTLMEQDLEWPEDLESGGKKHVSSRLPSRAPDIPVVHVCVQGGSEAIRTMLNTVMVSLPVLLVRGTGKATDLVADCVCLKFPPGYKLKKERAGEGAKGDDRKSGTGWPPTAAV